MLYWVRDFYKYLEIMNNASLVVVADLDLEKAILSELVFLSTSIRRGVIREDDPKYGEFRYAIESLTTDCFSYTIYADIFRFIKDCFTKKCTALDTWEIKKHLQNLPKNKNQQNTAADVVDKLLSDLPVDFSLRTQPLPELCKKLVTAVTQRQLRSKIKSQDELQIEELKALVDNLCDGAVDTKTIVQKGVKRYQNTSDPIERVLAKRQLRMQGLIPQEVQELTDNFGLAREVPKIVKGLDFLNEEFQESAWLYPGLIKAGVVNLITGIGGSGKSIFAIDCLLSFLNNSAFLGESPSVIADSEKTRGLIINADQPFSDLQGILRNNPLAWKMGKLDRLDIMRTNWCLLDILHLEMMMKENIYKVVVVDSYKAIHSHIHNWDENKPEASLGIRELQRICDVYGVTILLIHHAGNDTSKGRHKSRGHSSIADTASSVLSLTASVIDDKNSDPNVRFLDISKSRNSVRQSLTIKFNPIKFKYELLPDSKSVEREAVSKLADSMLREFNIAYPKSLKYSDLLSKMASSRGNKELILAQVLQKLEQRGAINKSIDVRTDFTEDFIYKLSSAMITLQRRKAEEEIDF